MTENVALTSTGPDTRTLLMDAAERIVVSQGVARMTLEEVAREAKVSKGGLLYHFPSKEALIEGMIEYFVRRFDTAMAFARDGDADPRGRSTRAYVRASTGQTPQISTELDLANGALTAALATFPERLEAVREQGRRHQAEIVADAIDPVLATIIRFATDGIWMGENFQLTRIDPALKAQVIARLIGWTHLDGLPDDGIGHLVSQPQDP